MSENGSLRSWCVASALFFSLFWYNIKIGICVFFWIVVVANMRLGDEVLSPIWFLHLTGSDPFNPIAIYGLTIIVEDFLFFRKLI